MVMNEAKGIRKFGYILRVGAPSKDEQMQVRDIISAGLCWCIKGGDHINIWSDPWVPTLNQFTPLLKTGALVGRNVNVVNDLISEETRSWNVQLKRHMFDPLLAMTVGMFSNLSVQ